MCRAHNPQLDRPFGHIVPMCLRGFGDGVEQQMMRIKILAAHIPVRLLGLGIKIAQIGSAWFNNATDASAPCGEHWFGWIIFCFAHISVAFLHDSPVNPK